MLRSRVSMRHRRTREARPGLLVRIRRGVGSRGCDRPWCFYLTAGVAGLAIVFGGGTRAGFGGDVILQLISLPLLWVALTELIEAGNASRVQWLLAGIAAIVALPLLQLVPLPSSLWTMLPGRSAIVATYELLGYPLPAFPLTVSPEATWLSALSLVPPVAVFLSMLTLGYEQRRHISLILISASVISVFLGLLQLAGGASSALRFYTVTNTGEAVGFFANRNHFAALLYAAMLFSFCWLLGSAETFFAKGHAARFNSHAVIFFAGLAVAFIVLLSGQLMARSRAGLVLSMVALIAGFILAMKDRRARTGRHLPKILLATIAIAIVLCSQFALFRILDRFEPDSASDARVAIVRNTISAAQAYMPFGSGLGTFVPVYQTFEKPSDITVTYVNHAHNDLLELWLETGLPGLVLLMLCIVWLARRAIVVWTTIAADDVCRIDRNLMRSATIVAGLLLAHSLVDYPLRTTANLVVFAFAVGLLVPPLRTIPAHSGVATPRNKTAPHRASRNAASVRQRALWCETCDWPVDQPGGRRENAEDVATMAEAPARDVRFSASDDKR